MRSLLAPLGLEPEWTLRDNLTAGIYYGIESPALPDVASLHFSPAAEDAYAALEPYDPGDVTWFESREGRLPSLFADGEGHPDLVASSFFFLSGWQEASVDVRDEHGRFPFECSLQMQYSLAHVPVVDAYREVMAEQLVRAGIELKRRLWGGKAWALCPTHDVDYLRKWRPGILYRDLVRPLFTAGSLRERRIRLSAVVGQLIGGDPYRDALRRMPREVLDRGGTGTYFFKAGGADPHDVSYRIDGRYTSRVLGNLKSRGFEIGLHPSYLTPDAPTMMKDEKRRLEAAMGERVISVRQHYLRFDPLETPRHHESAGFGIDSTLGFSEHEGFRRGTCLPFQLFDLEEDAVLDLWEMSLLVMDSTLFNRRGYSLAQAMEATKRLAEECRRYGGAMVVLWHNILWDELDCPDWGTHFTETLDLARNEDALIASLEESLRSWNYQKPSAASRSTTIL
ncbi:MAG: polysaccharide deacetylase family protein [Rhodothermales bacterium]